MVHPLYVIRNATAGARIVKKTLEQPISKLRLEILVGQLEYIHIADTFWHHLVRMLRCSKSQYSDKSQYNDRFAADGHYRYIET